jgi:hypothetical protein
VKQECVAPIGKLGAALGSAFISVNERSRPMVRGSNLSFGSLIGARSPLISGGVVLGAVPENARVQSECPVLRLNRS